MGKRARDEELKDEVRQAVRLVGGEYSLICGSAEELPNALTPFEKQMVSLKKGLPPYVVLLIACGYRVRCFGRDSRVISRRTGIMCIPSKPFEYSSVPYTRIDVYIQRLIAMGYHVAFADQESAAARAVEGKTNIFTRSISQVFSRGTFLPGEHVHTIGEMAAEAAATDAGTTNSTTFRGYGDPRLEEDVEKGEEQESTDSLLPMCLTAGSAAFTLMFLQYDVCRAHSASSTLLDVVMVNFVKQQQTVIQLKVIDIQKGTVESDSFASFQDALQRFDIAELILLGPLSLTPESSTHLLRHDSHPTMVANFSIDPHGDGCCTLGDLFRQHLPHTITSLLTQYLSLQWGPTITGEEDLGTVSMSAGLKRVDQSMEEAIIEYLRPYHLQDLYRQLIDEWNRNNSTCSCAPEVDGPSEINGGMDENEGRRGSESGTRGAQKAALTMTVPGTSLYALDVFPSSHIPLASRSGGGERSGERNAAASLFQLLNLTMTATGSRRLREWVAAPLRDYEDVMARQRAVQFLASGEDGGIIKTLLREAAGGRVGGGSGAVATGRFGGGSIDMEAILARLHGHRSQVLEFIRFLCCLRSMGVLSRQLQPMGTNPHEKKQEMEDGKQLPPGCIDEEVPEREIPSLLQMLLKSIYPPALEMWVSSQAKGLLESRATTPFELFTSGELSWPPSVEVQHHLQKAAESEQQLREELSSIRVHLNMPTLEYRVIAGTSYVIDIPSGKAERLAKPNWTVLSRTKANVRYHTPKIIEASTILAATKERIISASRQAWTAFQQELFQERHEVIKAMKEAVDAVGALDALHSLSMTARRQGYVAPRLVRPHCTRSHPSFPSLTAPRCSSFERDRSSSCPVAWPPAPLHGHSCWREATVMEGDTEKRAEEDEEDVEPPLIVIRQGRHPVVDEILHHQYVACDITLRQGDTILLTGPNMGGKSAFMRMVGIFVLMTQIGSYVPAESATLPLFDAIYCRMGASDNVLAGRSTFLTEIEETSRILSSPSLSRSFVLMDELGRGTSSYDGMAVASATLEYLASKGATSIFVTHYTSLCEPYILNPLKGAEGYDVKPLQEESSLPPNASSSMVTPAPCTFSRVQCYFMGYNEEKSSFSALGSVSSNEASLDVRSSAAVMNQEVTEGNSRSSMKGTRIFFTYRPCRGVTPSSFGIQVAMMAGLPSCVTDEAGKQSKRVESLYQLTRDITQLSRFMHVESQENS